MRVLIIEDEEALASAIARGLRREGMAVDVSLDGQGGLEKALVTAYDVVILDRNLRPPAACATRSPASTSEPTTTSASRSPSKSSWPASAPSRAAPAHHGRRCCAAVTSSSTRQAAARGARAASSS